MQAWIHILSEWARAHEAACCRTASPGSAASAGSSRSTAAWKPRTAAAAAGAPATLPAEESSAAHKIRSFNRRSTADDGAPGARESFTAQVGYEIRQPPKGQMQECSGEATSTAQIELRRTRVPQLSRCSTADDCAPGTILHNYSTGRPPALRPHGPPATFQCNTWQWKVYITMHCSLQVTNAICKLAQCMRVKSPPLAHKQTTSMFLSCTQALSQVCSQGLSRAPTHRVEQAQPPAPAVARGQG